MVLCWIALPVFAVLGIFSAKYRKLASESLECLFKTATFQRCKSGLDDRIKSQITGNLLKFSPASARFFYKHYKLISLVLLVLFIWSAYVSVVGIYNYVQYGNCNGPDSDGFCILDPTGENSGTCEIPSSVGEVNWERIVPKPSSDFPVIGNKEAQVTIIEFGCYVCPYTNDAEEIVKDVLDYYGGKVNLQFIVYPLPGHEFSYESSMASKCAEEQGKYLEYHEKLFEQEMNFKDGTFREIASELGLDVGQFDDCMAMNKYADEIEEDKRMALAAKVRGTPTFFVGEQEIVGPKPIKTFKNVIDEELGK